MEIEKCSGSCDGEHEENIKLKARLGDFWQPQVLGVDLQVNLSLHAHLH